MAFVDMRTAVLLALEPAGAERRGMGTAVAEGAALLRSDQRGHDAGNRAQRRAGGTEAERGQSSASLAASTRTPERSRREPPSMKRGCGAQFAAMAGGGAAWPATPLSGVASL